MVLPVGLGMGLSQGHASVPQFPWGAEPCLGNVPTGTEPPPPEPVAALRQRLRSGSFFKREFFPQQCLFTEKGISVATTLFFFFSSEKCCREWGRA